MNISPWNNLSIADKAAMMEVAIRNGITDLNEIRQKYNEFAKGGNLYPDGGGLPDDDIEKKVLKKEEEYNSKLAKPINIGYDKDRAFTLTNAGSLTGAHLSEEMTDYLIQEAEKAGVDMTTAFGIPAAESTLGNPTDDRSAWNISSGIRKDFNNVYPGTSQFINFSGDAVNEQDLVNFWGPLENQNPYTQQLEEAQRRAKKGEDYTAALKEGMAYADRLAKRPVHTGSITQQAYEYFKEHGEAYNPSYRRQTGKSYVQHVKEKGKEALQSPEIKQAINNYALRKIVPDKKIDYTPEWRRPYSNSKKYVPAWKKSLGGNLYPDGGYTRENGSPVSFDPITGDLIDQTTGQTGTLMLPEVRVNARDPRKFMPAEQKQIGADYWTQLANEPTWLDTFTTTVNGERLPEVIVKPTNDESWLFSLGEFARNGRKPLADSYTGKVVANYLSRFDNENAKEYNARISRLADAIYDTNGVQFQKNNRKNKRAYYDPNTETAKISNMDDLFAELAHPYQEWLGNNRMGDEFSEDYDNDKDPRGGTRYAYPDTFEGETHGFFEPALKEWVETGKIGRSLPMLNEDLSNEKIVPKDRTEVTDSAASWNKQAVDRRVLANPQQLPLSKRIQYSIFDYPLLNKKKSLGGHLYLYMSSGNENAYGGNLFGDGSYMEQAKALIRNNEGWSSTPYKDAPKGVSWRSVGYGFNDSGFREKYPEGISKHYEHGITRAQAEQELDYYLNKAEKQLRGIYGKKWNSFTDGQKAAILDTYYQRPASVANESAFYNAVMSGKDPSKYLGVVGFDKRNNIRRNTFLGGFSGSYDIPQDAYTIQQYNNIPTTLFAPSNPEVFFGGYKAPEIEAPLPSIELEDTPQYSEEEIARQERRERLNNLSMLMNLTSPQGSSNSMLDAIGLLMR